SELNVLVFDPKLENMIISSNQGQEPEDVAIEPNLAKSMVGKIQQEASRLLSLGQRPVLLAPDFLRPAMAKMLRKHVPDLAILSHTEVPENRKVAVIAVVK
ncbi:MAG: FHIPEP family type III secretion protein, partial [Limnobacter sp.]|nr:FHIPEP family type III secretion protein [Limnobacter sp.]